MLGNSLKCCSKQIGSSAFDFTNHHNLWIFSGLGSQRRWYAKDKSGCCKDTPQTAGRTVEVWPKPDPPPPAWRCECPREPMPYNNDPYRIKVPEIVVPPLPPGSAKEPCQASGEPFNANFDKSWFKNVLHNAAVVHPDYYKEKPVKSVSTSVVVLPKLGYHGRSKYKYAFHEPWNPLDRLSLMEQAEKDEKEYSKEIAALDKAEKDTCV